MFMIEAWFIALVFLMAIFNALATAAKRKDSANSVAVEAAGNVPDSIIPDRLFIILSYVTD